jgi:hypothetical protein
MLGVEARPSLPHHQHEGGSLPGHDGLMWLGRSLYSAQLNLDLSAQPVFASA